MQVCIDIISSTPGRNLPRPARLHPPPEAPHCDERCRETAPDNFKRNEDGGYSFVFKQPATPEEEGRCKEAKEGCPVEAIGDNGT